MGDHAESRRGRNVRRGIVEETIVAAAEGRETLYQALPYVFATLFMLGTVFGFLKWVMNHLCKVNEQQAERDKIVLDVVRENTAASQALKDSVEKLIGFCHLKNRKDGDEGES